MYPSANTQSGSSENNNISTETTTIPTSPSPFLSKDYFDNTLQVIISQYSGKLK